MLRSDTEATSSGEKKALHSYIHPVHKIKLKLENRLQQQEDTGEKKPTVLTGISINTVRQHVKGYESKR